MNCTLSSVWQVNSAEHLRNSTYSGDLKVGVLESPELAL